VVVLRVGRGALQELQQKLHYRQDKRIKFVGTVYDAELLRKIRERAYGYFHGHEVGGTNPSLLESLASTNLNLLLDVGFNREVGENAALYWTCEPGSLSGLIEVTDQMSEEQINAYGLLAKKRIEDAYRWDSITNQYQDLFNKESDAVGKVGK
jgi:rhamnosyltransferase